MRNLRVLAVTLLCISSLFAKAQDNPQPINLSKSPRATHPNMNAVIQQIADLTETDGKAGDTLGLSAAIGEATAVVGTGRTVPNGVAYVFVKPAGGWSNMTPTATLTSSDNAYEFGSPVAISSDGSTVLAGAPGAKIGKNGFQGAVYVFVKPSSGWQNMTETAKLTASDGQKLDSLGISVGISGSTVAAGAYQATIGSNSQQGAEYVFVKPSTGWKNMTQTAKLTASDGQAKDWMGWTSSISGNTVAVSVPNHDQYRGEIDVFVEPSGGWKDMTQTARLEATDAKVDDDLGDSVAISGDTVVGGAPLTMIDKNPQEGAAYVFVRPASGWKDMTQTAKLVPQDGQANQWMGVCASINSKAIVMGAPQTTVGQNAKQGAEYVFAKPAHGWKTMTSTAELVASDGQAGDELGWSVWINGKTVVAGAPYATVDGNADEGLAYVFPY